MPRNSTITGNVGVFCDPGKLELQDGAQKMRRLGIGITTSVRHERAIDTTQCRSSIT